MRLTSFIYITAKKTKTMGKTAIILGATGQTGGELLTLLLNDAAYTKIKLFSRTSVKITHDKIEEHLINFDDLENLEEDFTADVVFCCVGTTKAKTPDKDAYRKVDYGIPIDAAKLSKTNAIKRYLVVSAMGANYKSNIFYNRIKGDMERDVQFYQQGETYIFRPSLIAGMRDEQRLMESFAKLIFKIINAILPSKVKSISAMTIARAMLYVAENGFSETNIDSDVIRTLAKHG